MSDCLEITPLGGVGEFGMNCTALRYGSDMILIDAGVAAIIQPGGSKRDEETIAACDARGVAMILTGTRHFKH